MSDEASLIQERLDDLALTMFNGVLEVSRVSGDEGRKDDKCHVAVRMGAKIGYHRKALRYARMQLVLGCFMRRS